MIGFFFPDLGGSPGHETSKKVTFASVCACFSLHTHNLNVGASVFCLDGSYMLSFIRSLIVSAGCVKITVFSGILGHACVVSGWKNVCMRAYLDCVYCG